MFSEHKVELRVKLGVCKCWGLCPFLVENLEITKVPLSVQEDEIQTNPKESAKIPVIAELLSPSYKVKIDLEAHRNLMFRSGPIEQEALFYYWQKKMDKIEGVDPITREQNMALEMPSEEIPVIIENFTQPESTIEINETVLMQVLGPLRTNDSVLESVFVSPEEFQSKKVAKQATKVSSVITSGEYIASLEEKKRAQEELERQRIEKKLQKRERKKDEKEFEKQERKRIWLNNSEEKQKKAKKSKTK